MHATHVITRLVVGGAQENTIASILGLNKKPGFSANLITGTETGPEGSLENSFSSHKELLVHMPELIRAIHPWKDFLAYRHLTRNFRSTQPDIVHTHSGKAGILGRLAAHKAGVPLIIHTIHGPSFGPFQGPLSNWLFTSAERRAGRVTHHFVAVADAMISQYRLAGIGKHQQYTKILSGFDLAPFLSAIVKPELKEKLGINDRDFVVGKIARLSDLKGHEHLLNSAPRLVKKCPNIKFLLVGDGPLRNRFQEQVTQMGLKDHFIFTGLVRPDEVTDYVALMQVLVHLSAREGLPRALPQAMAAGKPVVAMDCDGAREVCLDGQTGFLIPHGNTQALITSILELQHSPALCDHLGEQGREWVQNRFPVQKMVDDLHSLYLKLWETRGAKSPSHRQAQG